jgi:hypothetical protein
MENSPACKIVKQTLEQQELDVLLIGCKVWIW